MSRAHRAGGRNRSAQEPCDCPTCSRADIDPAQLITDLVASGTDLAAVDDALDAEMIGAGMVTMVAAAGADLPPEFGPRVIADIEARGDRDALALLSAIGSVRTGARDLAALAAAAADRVAAGGVPRPRWAAELMEPLHAGDCLRLNDHDNGMTVLIAPFQRANEGHAVVVATDENDCGAATDILIVDAENLPELLGDVLADSPAIQTERVDPARLRWYVENALEARDAHDAEDPYGAAVDLLEDDDENPGPPYPAQALLVRLRMAALPQAVRPAGARPHHDDHPADMLAALEEMLPGLSPELAAHLSDLAAVAEADGRRMEGD
jgi:hypothetical protein